jgi:hypothetical protein
MVLKTKYIILTTFIVVSLAKSALCQSESYSIYQQRIKAIDHQVVDLTAPSDLFGVSNFVALYVNPRIYLANAMRYISDATNSDDCKMIVVYSLQDLPLHNYVSYERNLLYLAHAGLLSKSMLNKAVFPALDWSTKIEVNFDNTNVESFLRECIQSDLITPENKAYFKEVLSGKVKQDVSDLEDGGLLPKRPDRAD